MDQVLRLQSSYFRVYAIPLWSWREIPCPNMAKNGLPRALNPYNWAAPWGLGAPVQFLGKCTEYVAFITQYMSPFGKLPFSGIRHADEWSLQSDSWAEISQFKNIPWVVYKLCTSWVLAASARGVAGGLSAFIYSWLVITQKGCICHILSPLWWQHQVSVTQARDSCTLWWRPRHSRPSWKAGERKVARAGCHLGNNVVATDVCWCSYQPWCHLGSTHYWL